MSSPAALNPDALRAAMIAGEAECREYGFRGPHDGIYEVAIRAYLSALPAPSAVAGDGLVERLQIQAMRSSARDARERVEWEAATLITELQAKVARMEVEAFDAAIAHGKTKLALAKSEASREAAPVRSPDAVTLETYYARQIEWSRDTFGPALRTKGAIDHIRKELAEIEADPHDLSEWVDVIILAMDGFWRHGGTAESLMPALLAKQAKNMARAWPDWRTMSEDRAIEHDRSGDALSSPQPPDPAAVRVTHEVTDLLTEVGRMPADFPNYADWSVTLPAGHWRALSAALASARPEGWRTMNSAPRDGTRILATGGGLNSRVDIVEYLPNVGAWEGNGYVFDDCDDEPDGYSRPSRWMPLPPLPLKR